MGFFENTRRPKGFSGKIMVKMMNSGHSKLAHWGFSKVSVKEDAKILDAGCGGGANIALWLERCKNGHVTGIDYSEISVEESKKRNSAAIKQNRCEIIQGNVADMPFADSTFDCVSAFETIYFWPGLERCFGEVYRILKSGGIFMICNESDGTNTADEKWTEKIGGMKIYDKEQIGAALKSVEFSETRSFSDEKKHWLCILAKK
ncbi:MAG: class I SAM-dependent methyltransferase [Blautia sp.]